MKNDVTLSGLNGVVPSGNGENTKASAGNSEPASAIQWSALDRCRVRRANPTGSSATDRPRFVFVDFSTRPPGATTKDLVTSIVPTLRSTSDYRSAQSSPRRMPVSAANIRSGASLGSRRSAPSITSRTISNEGAVTRLCETRGGFAISAAFKRTQPSGPPGGARWR